MCSVVNEKIKLVKDRRRVITPVFKNYEALKPNDLKTSQPKIRCDKGVNFMYLTDESFCYQKCFQTLCSNVR